MIVVDTNILAYLYLDTPQSQQAEQLYAIDTCWCAPILWRSEFRSVLSLYLRKTLLSREDCLLIFQQAEAVIGANEYNVATSVVLNLLQTSDCSAYDCEFVVLAQELDTRLITSDKQILRAYPQRAQSLETYLKHLNS